MSDARGQATTEYVVLTGMVVSIAVLILNVLGGSLRDAFRAVVGRLLSVVTGTP